MDDIRTSFLSRIRYYRREDSHECALINGRMAWLMIIQSGLIISFFIVAGNKDPLFVFSNSLFLFFVSVFFAQILSRAVRKAELVIYEWRSREIELYKELKTLKNNDLIKELESYFVFKSWEAEDEKERKKESDAFSFQRIVFPGLMVFWSTLIVYSAYNFLEYKVREIPVVGMVSFVGR